MSSEFMIQSIVWRKKIRRRVNKFWEKSNKFPAATNKLKEKFWSSRESQYRNAKEKKNGVKNVLKEKFDYVFARFINNGTKTFIFSSGNFLSSGAEVLTLNGLTEKIIKQEA